DLIAFYLFILTYFNANLHAGGIFRNVKKDKENSKCLFNSFFHNFIFKNNLVFLIFLNKF
uniref:hypothetical protein n=1 Tax=uncultured Streptococcus sp. TaxID=83427 RepID=UPI0028E9D32E